MIFYFKRSSFWVVLLILSGCVAPTTNRRAPIEEHHIGSSNQPSRQVVEHAKQTVSKSRLYFVQKGDTLFSIAFSHGLDYRDLAELNKIDDPSVIKIGQTIRLSVDPAAIEGSEPVASLPVINKVDKNKSSLAAEGEEDPLDWASPAKGTVIANFSESANRKGVDIAGKFGSPIVASAAGKVVYSGNGLRGYGKLVIIKHNKLFLSAYAHNDQILVKEGQMVTKGQKIAEMGNTDADQVKLHFEIRKLGKPVDPAQYLPALTS